jgi:deoxyribonuclease (pyrimidine dimer)
MTRINCVPAAELCRQHLVAEYRELPRVFKLAEAAAHRGQVQAPDDYTLGPGHVKFFYTRLGYCRRRFQELVAELLRRGYHPQYTSCPAVEVPAGWHQDWQPTAANLQLNRQRLADRQPKPVAFRRAQLVSTQRLYQ